jgi:tRNA1Val (adenine37-N6)-methyltransferase
MPAMNPPVRSDETLDTFLDGRIEVIQQRCGYRFSIDAVLLSQFVRLQRNDKVVDLGTGCGILPLLLSQTTKAVSFVGVEVQKGLADLALRNVRLNQLESRIAILHQDFRSLKKTYPPGAFNVALSNPPYRRHLSGRTNPSAEKAIARHEIKGTLDDLISMVSYLLPPKGRCYLIYPATRAVDLLVTLRGKRVEPKRIQWVYPHAHEEAKLILIEALKASGVELKTLPPLILHEKPFRLG